MIFATPVGRFPRVCWCVCALAFAAVAQAGTWSAMMTDNFTRANSATIGNGWEDPAGVGAIVGNTLKLTVPAGGAGTDLRVSRPVAEASHYQRIEATYVLPATNDGLSHSVYVRGKSLVIGGEEIHPVIMVNVRHTGVVTARLAYQGGAGFSLTTSGTNSFSPTAGRSYTLAVQATNRFPVALAATVRDNTTGNQVASITYSDLGEYAANKLHLSRDFISSGVMGVAMEGGGGKSVSFTGVTTYSWNETGAFTAGITPVSSQSDGITYLASPFPSGGTPPYKIRWYRGANNFTPSTNINGTGGTGTYLGDTFECADMNPPAGVTNSSISYRAVYFDSGANATTGILSSLINKNSPPAQSYAIPFWIGDSITAGYATSNGAYTKSPGFFAQNYLNADAGFLAAYTMPIKGALNNYGLSGRTSADLADRSAYIIGQTRLIGATFANIMLGTNDSKNSVQTAPADYKANIETIIAALKASRPDIKIVLNKPTWFKPDTGFAADFSTASLARVAEYRARLDQLADGTSIVVGGLVGSNELQTHGWTGTLGTKNVANATTAYPPAPTGGKSYLVDGLHPYDGGSEMIGKLEWGPNAKKALLGSFTPFVSAGADQTIALPTSTVTLSGSASSAGHSITSYAWTKVQGGTATIVSPTAASTQITGLVAGTYVFRLTATDNVGSVGLGEVQVTVNTSGFASWLGEHGFGGDAAPAADPDGNGLGHLAEYAFGIAPGATDTTALPRLEIAADTLRYTYPSPRADIVYQPQWSLDLIEWSTSGFVVNTTGDITTAELALGENPRLFLRLKITLVEA